jgi:hypothetical protein
MTRHLTYPLITKITAIATRAADDAPANCIEVEVQTPLGRGVLHMSHDAAFALGAKLVAYTQPADSGSSPSAPDRARP